MLNNRSHRMCAADPDRACKHLDFEATVEVNRLTSEDHPGAPVTAYITDVRVLCAACGEKFRWIGVPAGMRPDRPMVSVDETKLHAPMRPASADPDFGLGIPGFRDSPFEEISYEKTPRSSNSDTSRLSEPAYL